MNSLPLKLILTVGILYGGFTLILKITKYLQGYGWTYTRITWTPNPLYGLIDPKKATTSERTLLLVEIIFQFILGVLTIWFLINNSEFLLINTSK